MKPVPGKVVGQPLCYIGLGSNLGDRMANCKAAVEALGRLPNTLITAVSSIYETEPVYSEGLAWPARAWGAGGTCLPAGRSEDSSSPHPHGPLHKKDQGPWFLNGVLGISTGLDPEDLLTRCQQIEASLGRPEVRPDASPRTIDLDILLYGEQVFNTPTLQIPHPRMHERAFVLIPLAEIAPNAWHAVLKKTIAELRDQLKDSHEVKRFGGREIYCD